MKNVTIACGNGGVENNDLIQKVFYKYFKNDILEKNEDSAIIDSGKLAFSTDSFTVSPLFFKGGDIGKLAICGTCNDIAMMGAKPLWVSCAVIIEEGFDMKQLDTIVSSMKKELAINGAKVVCGDTKVVPKGAVDKIFINTSAVGQVQKKGISSNNISKDDIILINRDIGSHGATIFTAREGMDMSGSLQSDCTSLYPQVQALLDANIDITALRDATRGGVSASLNEWAKQSKIGIVVDESSIPIKDEVQGVCELLGFEAVNLANEGTFLLAINNKDEEKALEVLKRFDQNNKAAKIANITDEHIGKVVIQSSYGTKRYLEMPSGELLPRIC
ncbi:MAG: hydrogenase expression/formation protein HypE [Campylobacteraceae bacterium 4484_166]|nr:MAG: hydrogenase expression/formation protein HypE [Campylobacteraceae bacterium 4484_166]